MYANISSPCCGIGFSGLVRASRLVAFDIHFFGCGYWTVMNGCCFSKFFSGNHCSLVVACWNVKKTFTLVLWIFLWLVVVISVLIGVADIGIKCHVTGPC